MSDAIGFQAVRAVLTEAPGRARALYVLKGRRDARVNEVIALAKAAGVRFQSKENAWFKQRVEDGAHQGVVLECHELSLWSEADLFAQWDDLGSSPLLLILDEVTDPRNFGACLRTANAAGVDAVMFPKRNSAPLNAVALKTAQGGAESLRLVEVTNLARCIKELQNRNVWVVGADGTADTSYLSLDATGPLALICGSEGKGLRRLTRESCDQLLKIDMYGQVESLNVSVACGVMLFEFARQRA